MNACLEKRQSTLLNDSQKPRLMGGLCFILVILLHLCVAWYLLKPEPIPLEKPKKIIEVSLVAPPVPSVPTPPVAAPEPPPPPPPPPKPVEKPKPVLKPKVAPLPVKPPPKQKPIRQKPMVKPEPEPLLEQDAPPPPTPVAPPVTAAPPKVVAPPAPPAPPKPVAKPAPITGVKELNCPTANYPEMAKRRHWEGKAVLTLIIAPDGSVEKTSILESSGHDVLDQAAENAAKNCEFSKGTEGVMRSAKKAFSFALNDDESADESP